MGFEALTVHLVSHTYRKRLNQKQTSVPLFLFSLRLHWLLVFVHGFVSGPSSCSTSIFTCSRTVHKSTPRVFASKLEFFLQRNFPFLSFFFPESSQVCIIIQIRRRNAPSFIKGREHKNICREWIRYLPL